MKDGYLLPSLFVLLPNKTEVTYTRMWQQIQLLYPAAHPIEMIVDIAKASLNSFAHFWPDTLLKCCFLRLTKNIWARGAGWGNASWVQSVWRSGYMHPTATRSSICSTTPCKTTLHWSSWAAANATSSRSAGILRRHLHQTPAPDRNLPGVAISYPPVELSHLDTIRSTLNH